MSSEVWSHLGFDDRYRARIRAATVKIDPRHVVSHVSALAVHEVSHLRHWPRQVHVTDPDGGRGQIRDDLVKHSGPLSEFETEVIGGTRVTTAARTCIDVARTSSFEVAVAAIDEFLHVGAVTLPDLVSAFERCAFQRGRLAVQRALCFATEQSDSAGESWCRCVLHELGAPAPELQKEFRDARGRIAFVDFWFETSGVVVEFDGDQKYLQQRYGNGRTTSQIILDERKRERRLLALPEVREVVRVEWNDLDRAWHLRSMLAAAGVPLG